jgi:hypothetical protein
MASAVTDRITIRVHVEGRASARWRNARSVAEAAELNQNLSVQRAISVAWLVRSEIARVFPKAAVVLTGTGFGYSDLKKAIPIGFEGHGSRKPLIPEDKTGNEAINRSVLVTVSRVRTVIRPVTKWRPGAKYRSLSQIWELQILKFDAAALGYGRANIRFRLTNPLSKKSRRYEAVLSGVGFDNPLQNPKDTTKRPQLPQSDDPNPKSITFRTAKPVGFTDFDNNEITVWKAKAGVGLPKIRVGVAVSDTFFKFNGLGGTSDNILIDFSVELSSLTFSGFRMKGTIKPLDQHPGDFITNTEMYDDVEVVNDKGENGFFVTFETGKSALTADWAGQVRKWAGKRAKFLEYLAQRFP